MVTKNPQNTAKIIVTFLIALFLVGGISCKKNANSEVKNLMGKMTELGETFADDLNKAKDSKEVAALMSAYGEKIAPLLKAMRELPKKYPELEGQKVVPDELKEVSERYSKAMSKQSLILAELLVKYQDNKEFNDARSRLMEVLTK